MLIVIVSYTPENTVTLCEIDTGLLADASCGSHIHTLSNVSTSTILGLLQGRGSLFSSTAKFSGGRALRDGFLRSEPASVNLRFRGVAFSLFFCRGRAKFGRPLGDHLIVAKQTC